MSSREQRLEAALQEAQQCLYRDGANAAGEVKALIDAVLGDQEAPTEPTCRYCKDAGVLDDGSVCGDCYYAGRLATTPTEPTGGGGDTANASAPPSPAAPQVAPEPERLASCESCGRRATVNLPDGSWWCEECDEVARRYECPKCGSGNPAVRGAVPAGRNVDESGMDVGRRVAGCDHDYHGAAPEPERCPTCRSDVRWKRGWMVFDTPCWDPWHRPAPLVEGEPTDA